MVVLSGIGGGRIDFVKLLIKFPEAVSLMEKSDWEKLSGRDWAYLLTTWPEFAGYCDFSKIDGWGWAGLLGFRPQFADRCDFSKFSERNWGDLLKIRPELKKYRRKCNEGSRDVHEGE